MAVKLTSESIGETVDGPWTTTQQYDYYETTGANGRKGQVRRVIVPDVDGSYDQVTEYQYDQDSVVQDSPTRTIYQVWDAVSSYTTATTVTVYDDAGQVTKTTDGGGRSVWYLYDDLGRQTHMVYKWVNEHLHLLLVSAYNCAGSNRESSVEVHGFEAAEGVSEVAAERIFHLLLVQCLPRRMQRLLLQHLCNEQDQVRGVPKEMWR